MACRNIASSCGRYRVAMNDKPTPPAPPQNDDTQGEVVVLFGQPVVRGATHHTQSITPIATVQSQPIKKKRSKDWWKRSPQSDR